MTANGTEAASTRWCKKNSFNHSDATVTTYTNVEITDYNVCCEELVYYLCSLQLHLQTFFTLNEGH